MREFLQKLFDTADFPARWKCGVWSAELGWTHIISDLAIFGAYAAIPVSLIYFVRRRRDVPFPPIFWLFAAFIFACGFGHLIEATIFWHPWYRFSGAVKLFTAVVSWLTVVALIKVLPKALTLPGLLKLNRQLEAEVAERKRVEEEIVQINAALEHRVTQRTAELEERAAELALTSQYKSEFLANMSHELRTPLNSILILGQNLAENAEGNLTARQVEFSKCIRSAGTDLLNLINEILDLSKVESGTVAVDAEEIRFTSLRDALDRNFRHLAESQKLPFHIGFDSSLPATLCTDRRRLQQILTNLLSNAFKFTAQGRVDVTVRITANGFSSNHPVLSHAAQVVSFAVTDTGIGIAREKHKLIFEAFQQADAGTARKYGGTGLGLTISRELAALLGGEIQLMSIPGEGSTFTLYLPVQYPGPTTTSQASVATPVMLSSPSDAMTGDPSASTLETLRTSSEVLRGRKTLVVDDDARNIFALTTLLEKLEMEVLTATNGRDAIELIERTDDLGVVLMDIMMPDMDGYETIREIRKSPAGYDLPILALTAKAMKGDCEKCLEAGASGYIAKPVNAGHLQSLLLTWIRREEVTLVMNDPIPILLVDDKIENLVAIESILESPDYHLVRAQSGQEALLALLEVEFAALVLDVMMPGMSGIELARMIRDRKKTRHVPILFLTAHGEEGAVAGYEAGAVDFLTKPVQPAILRSKLAVFAELFRHRRALAEANQALQIETERRRQAQEALRATHDVLLENTAVGIAHLGVDGRWLRVNGRLVDITGYSREELLEKSCQDLTHRDDLAASLAQLQALATGDIPHFSLEKRYLRKDGSPVWIRLSVGLVRAEDGKPQHFVSVVEDITQRKLAEDQVRASLAEKEVLLKEIHHRVKNNLQIFSSLLNLESRHHTNPEMRAMIQEIQGRVRSMAVLHEKLYQTESLATIDLADYLRSLVKMLQRFSPAADAVELRWDLEPITADADTALPLGLVFAEVTTNAFKYAFANRHEGCLTVTLRSQEDGGFELEVKDDGPGMPPDFDSAETKSLGIRLVQMFARQLNAEAMWRSEPGETVFSLRTIRTEPTDTPCQTLATLASS